MTNVFLFEIGWRLAFVVVFVTLVVCAAWAHSYDVNCDCEDEDGDDG